MVMFSKMRRLISKRGDQADTINQAGGRAHTVSPRHELVAMVTTNLVADRFYSSAEEDLRRLDQLVGTLSKQHDVAFAAKAAIYARKEHGLRSITHALAGILGRHASGSDWGRRFFEKVIHRPDDMCEILAFYWLQYGADAPVPNAMKRGFSKVLSGLDAYQVAKYKGGGRAVSLVDVVNLTHPKSTPALSGLVNGTLAPPRTWEQALTTAGKEAAGDDQVKASMKAEAWKELLQDGRLGYFAALRNVRNICEQASAAVPMLVTLLTDPASIRKSLVLPFQIAKAIDIMERIGSPGRRQVIEALHDALDISLDNVPDLKGRTLIALDTSYSMSGRPIDIGALFAAVLLKSQSQADLLTFSNRAQYLSLSTRGSTYSIAEAIRNKCDYGGTNFHAIFTAARAPYDRIIILSDMQAWIGHHTPASAHARYTASFGVDPFIYTWDLEHYGTAQFPAARVCALAGWTDKVFDIMGQVETDPDALINRVDAIAL